MLEIVNNNSFLHKSASSTTKTTKQTKKQIDKMDVSIADLKAKKKRYLEFLADNSITHDEYREVADEAQEKMKN